MTAVAAAVGIPAGAGVIDGRRAPRRARARWREAAEENTIFCRIRPEQKKALVSALAERGRFTAMIGDGVNDVPALKRARLAVAMGSGSQITKGIADIVLLKDQFSRLPRAVAEGRRIARNIHRLGPALRDQDGLRGGADRAGGDPGLGVPLPPPPADPRRVPHDRDPLASSSRWRPATGRSTGAGCCGPLRPSPCRPGSRSPPRSLASFFLVDTVFGGSLEAGRTAATTTLVVLGLCFILLLERGPGREHIAIQSYMLALVAALGALYALVLAVEPVRDFFDMTRLGGGQLFLALLSAAGGLVLASVVWRLPAIEQLEDKPPPPEDAPTGPVTSPMPAAPRAPGGPPAHASGKGDRGEPAEAHQDRRHDGPGEPGPRGDPPADRGGRGRLPPQFLPRQPGGARRERRPGSARRARSWDGEVGILGDLPGPKLRLGNLEDDVAILHSDSKVVLVGEGDGKPGRRRAAAGPVEAGFAKAVRRGIRSSSRTAGCA